MSDEQFDRQISDALSAEAARAQPKVDAWASIASDVATRRVPWLLVGGAAAVLLLVAGLVAMFVLPGGDGDTTNVVTEPTVESTTSTSTSSTTSTSTSTTAPAETSVVYAPIDMGPLPPTRSTPPETLIAVQPDGTLVHIETATGRVLAEIANRGDLRDKPDEGSPSGIDGVALSPDGDTVLVSVCCEPAVGQTVRTSISQPRQQAPFVQTYGPSFSSSADWWVSASHLPTIWRLTDPGFSTLGQRSWPEAPLGFATVALSTDGARFAIAQQNPREPGQLLVIDPTATVPSNVAGAGEIFDETPLVVDGDWAEPVFARDGSLLVAELADDGSWSPWIIDPASGARSLPRLQYEDGLLLDQDYDPSAEWLLYVVAPTSETLEGTLHWIGPNGQTGTVPGNFYAASW